MSVLLSWVIVPGERHEARFEAMNATLETG
jgi:hypothetical protein